jgi:hypothetical protein
MGLAASGDWGEYFDARGISSAILSAIKGAQKHLAFKKSDSS